MLTYDSVVTTTMYAVHRIPPLSLSVPSAVPPTDRYEPRRVWRKISVTKESENEGDGEVKYPSASKKVRGGSHGTELYTPCYSCTDVVREGSRRFELPRISTLPRALWAVHALCSPLRMHPEYRGCSGVTGQHGSP